ncbi:hypothetical protein Anas_01693 [Armadillidium nasatum]|uniref:Uncharacterized protein n=1 Tax=Armadillidium nasatum TaxID=96803 RepID=A0A5N5TJU8_9CRUS|nr:hypothetical protein Anas_01693 [Armadillidium nasatum]
MLQQVFHYYLLPFSRLKIFYYYLPF